MDVVSVYLYSTARYAGASSSEDPLASIPKRFWIPKHPCVLGPGPWAKYFVAALRFKPGKRGEEPPELAWLGADALVPAGLRGLSASATVLRPRAT